MARRGPRLLGHWAVLLGAPLIWALHLALIYAAASLEVTFRGYAGLASALFICAATLGCLAAIFFLGRAVWRRRIPRWETPQEDLVGLWRKVIIFLCILSSAGVLWQGLAVILIAGHPTSHAALYGGTAPPDWRSR